MGTNTGNEDENEENEEKEMRQFYLSKGVEMNVWENVLAGRGKSTISEVIEQVDRLKMPGGWLVRNTIRETVTSMQRQQMILTMNTTFVPDKEYKWELKEDDKEIVKNLIKKGE